MNKRTFEILEYDRVRAAVAGSCLSEEGRLAMADCEPRTDAAEIARLKALCTEWMSHLHLHKAPPFTAWPPVGPFLNRLPVEGATLDLEQFASLLSFCESVCQMRAWAVSGGEELTPSERAFLKQGPDACGGTLRTITRGLPDLAEAVQAISRVVDRSGQLRDLAELRAIRSAIGAIRKDIDRLIHGYLWDDSLRTMLQSTVPAFRDGRQVLALKANFRGRVRGIVHEVSQSGQTLYLEPESVVDRNNDLVAEEHRLSREIQRILRELTARVAPLADDITAALASMIFLDGIGAAARWGLSRRCVPAVDAPFLRLTGARHPLLGDTAVPIDLALPDESRVMIVTGPNTGGKTVALKTVALFALINQSGWPIPARDGSSMPVFDKVLCDIGDEQSLTQSLSTFSAHMKNVAGMLRSAGPRSLVILDELGSGTDPQEGGALAMAILDTLLERGPLVLVTTHHGILKNYGYTHRQCVNASVDFDQNTLSPTYRILMGVPGESHALDIAGRNGLEAAIVEKARSYIKEEQADVSALIKGLTAKHEQLARFEEVKQDEERSLREKRRKTDLKELQLRQRELELREHGYRQFENLMSQSRKDLENLVRALREGELNREKTVRVKGFIAELEKTVDAEYAELEKARSAVAELRSGLQKDLSDSAARSTGTPSGTAGRRERKRRAAALDNCMESAAGNSTALSLENGLEVLVGESRQRGILVRPAKKGFWLVTVGPLNLTVAESDIYPLSARDVRSPVVEIHTELGTDETPAWELKLIGMRYDEAIKAMERQLDLAVMKGLKDFSVVHGKGQGVLQEAVLKMLRENPHVADFGFARPEHGGSGKTLVRLI